MGVFISSTRLGGLCEQLTHKQESGTLKQDNLINLVMLRKGHIMEIYKYIGSQIRKLRQESGLSQDALAKEMDVSTNTVSRWETATYNPHLKDLQRLADFFHVRLSTMLPPEESEQELHKALLDATCAVYTIGRNMQELVEHAESRRAQDLLRESAGE